MHCGECQIISVAIKAFSCFVTMGKSSHVGVPLFLPNLLPSWSLCGKKTNFLSYHRFCTLENWGILGDSEILSSICYTDRLTCYFSSDPVMITCIISSQSQHSSPSVLQYLSKPPWCIPILWPSPSVPNLSSHANSLAVRFKLLLLLIPKLIQQHFLKRKHEGFFFSWCFITC